MHLLQTVFLKLRIETNPFLKYILKFFANKKDFKKYLYSQNLFMFCVYLLFSCTYLLVIRQHIIAASHDMRIHLFFCRFDIMLLECFQNPSMLFDRYLRIITF